MRGQSVADVVGGEEASADGVDGEGPDQESKGDGGAASKKADKSINLAALEGLGSDEDDDDDVGGGGGMDFDNAASALDDEAER